MSNTENVDIRFRLRGANEAAREAYRTAGAFKAASAAAKDLGNSVEHTHRRTFLFNQAMFTARRVLFDITTGAAAAAGALAFVGIKFNATMDTNRVAMQFLTGSAKQARDEINFLFNLAKNTPFQFAGVSDIARQFLGWGFTIKQTNRYLSATADALAAMGGNINMADAVARAFGQIRSKGRLMGQEMLQLQNAIPGVYGMLQEQLHLSSKQMANLATTGIDANTAIEAIVTGMEKKFSGASAILAKTVTGQFEKLKDTTQQLMGQIMMAPFLAIQRNFPRVLTTMSQMNDAMRNAGFFAMAAVLDKNIGAGGALTVTLQRLQFTMRDIAAISQNALWPAFKANVQILWFFLKPLLLITGGVLHLMAIFKGGLVPILFLLIAAWTAHKIILIANWFWEHKNSRAIRTSTGWIWKQIIALKAWAFAQNRLKFAVNGTTLAGFKNNGMIAKSIRIMFAAAAATKAYTLAIMGATRAMIAFLLTNPVGWVILAIAGLIALELKWHLVQRSIENLWGLLKRFARWVTGNKISWDDLLPGAGFFDKLKFIPGFQGMGLAWEGLQRLPSFSGSAQAATMPARSIAPTKSTTANFPGGVGQGLNITIQPQPINLDGRQIAEGVYKHRLDRVARR